LIIIIFHERKKKSNSQYWLVSNDRPSEIDGSKKESLQFADMTK